MMFSEAEAAHLSDFRLHPLRSLRASNYVGTVAVVNLPLKAENRNNCTKILINESSGAVRSPTPSVISPQL